MKLRDHTSLPIIKLFRKLKKKYKKLDFKKPLNFTLTVIYVSIVFNLVTKGVSLLPL